MTYFEVMGEPQGKARARTFYNSKLGRMQSITPEGTVLYENLVKQCFLANCTETYFEKEPLEMVITAHFPIPKSASKKDKLLMRVWKVFPTKKPDADNIAKCICDALNGVAYGDDTQIVRMTVNKVYADHEPKVCVFLGEIKLGAGICTT